MQKILVLVATLLLPAGANASSFVPPIVDALNGLRYLRVRTTGTCPDFKLDAEADRIAAQAGCSFNGTEPACSGMDAGKSAWLIGQQDYMKRLADTADGARRFWGTQCPWDYNQAIITKDRAEIKEWTAGMTTPPYCVAEFETSAVKAVARTPVNLLDPNLLDGARYYYGTYLGQATGFHDLCGGNNEGTSRYENYLMKALSSVSGASPDLRKQLQPVFDSLASVCPLYKNSYSCSTRDGSVIADHTPKLVDLIALGALGQAHDGLTPEAFVKKYTMTVAAAQAAYGDDYFRLGTAASTAEKFSAPIATPAAYDLADKAIVPFKTGMPGWAAIKQKDDYQKKTLGDRIDRIVAAENQSGVGAGELKAINPGIEAAKPGLTCGGRCDDIWQAKVDAGNRSLDAVQKSLDAATAAFKDFRAKADTLKLKAAALPSDKKELVVEQVADFKAGLADDTQIQASNAYDKLVMSASKQGVN